MVSVFKFPPVKIGARELFGASYCRSSKQLQGLFPKERQKKTEVVMLIGAFMTVLKRLYCICYLGPLAAISKVSMGRLLISRADSSAASARRRTTAHPTVVSRVLCTGYVVNKKISCVLISKIWTQLQ
jgi:hypothetical protein